ncbi:hypothetical protein AV530_007692 [Patagioenas fasciata monilis]|uniref:Uncharacterized protein n=1 Tax=Patagioenas fasciata monilis TaxID=372326 RepID=A0A1V4JZ36_PATFA|nr:hypothetical protein AV530_007692 [Patagioenas fasciata monilis]
MRRARCRALLGAEPARPGLPLPARRPHGSVAGVTTPQKVCVPAARTERPGGSRGPPARGAVPEEVSRSAQLQPEEEGGEAQPDQECLPLQKLHRLMTSSQLIGS